MRKPRDLDSELQALSDKAKQLKSRKLQQLGELVIATGADAFPIEQLAGALLTAVEAKEPATKEGWRKRGAAFFRRERTAGQGAGSDAQPSASDTGGALSSAGGNRAS
ncbi:conjugal transfer protein TraD [Sphingomonas sp. HF-S3]|uniref:Conjugal transfer protein TraD n=1 Tax=Sphingomonas rustica TaxID=3103142 RepID=A0ABV0BB04_9SPHN